MKAVIFDLDDTLIQSSALRPLRDEMEWDSVKAQMQTVAPFDGAADLMQQARQAGCKTAIVTSSPKWYASYMIDRHGFPVDVLIAHGDYEWGKPSAEPIQTALEALGVNNSLNALAIGDRCIDTAAGNAAEVWTMGAAWGAANPRDLKFSWPDYVAEDFQTASETLDGWLSANRPESLGWASDLQGTDFWRTNPPGDHRVHISGAYPYTHARYRYRGIWSTSYTNSLISTFKSKSAKQHFFKEKMAKEFAWELSLYIPKGAYVTYVLPSTKKGEDGYDDRWELLAEALQKHEIHSLWPIQTKQSTEAAHDNPADSPLRDPEVVMENLEWIDDLPADCTKLYLIDDVLTKGGHMRGYADFIQEGYPDLEIECVAWALHTGNRWHEPHA